MAAATTDAWSRPWTARSIQLPTANSSQTTQTTSAVGERNVCGLPTRLAYAERVGGWGRGGAVGEDQAPVTPGRGWATIAPSSHRAVIAVAAITRTPTLMARSSTSN